MATTRSRQRRVDSDAIDDHPLAAGSDAGRRTTTPPDADQAAPRRVRPERVVASPLNSLDWRQAVGGAMIGLGMLAILIAWFGVSGTLDPGRQMPYISSGGFGGSALIAVGVTLLVTFEHIRDREALRDVLDELDAVRDRLDALQSVDGMASPSGT